MRYIAFKRLLFNAGVVEKEVQREYIENVYEGAVPATLRPLGGTLQTAVLTLFGTHSTKEELCLLCRSAICWSTSFMETCPRSMHATVIGYSVK